MVGLEARLNSLRLGEFLPDLFGDLLIGLDAQREERGVFAVKLGPFARFNPICVDAFALQIDADKRLLGIRPAAVGGAAEPCHPIGCIFVLGLAEAECRLRAFIAVAAIGIAGQHGHDFD